MAYMKPAKTEEQIKSMKISEVRELYIDLANKYNEFIDGTLLRCPKCGDIMRGETSFYYDKNYTSGRYPICKKCLLAMVEQRYKRDDQPRETKESVQKVLRMMDRVYDDTFYNQCVKGVEDDVNEKSRSSPFAVYITSIQSLPNWRGKTWADSDFGVSDGSVDDVAIHLNDETIKKAKKRFGSSGWSSEEYMFLENEYQDWITRYECNTKAQEEVFENLAILKLVKRRAVMNGAKTKDIDDQIQGWLDTGKLKPKQNSTDALSEAQTFGTFIQKVEETRPCAEIDPELRDVDRIGLMIDVFFRGHAAKMIGIKNSFSHLYEKVMARYTVKRPEYSTEDDSEAIFEKVFGSVAENDG